MLSEKEIGKLLKTFLSFLQEELELENVDVDIEELQLKLQPVISQVVQKPVEVEKVVEKPPELVIPKATYSGKVVEVKLGAAKSEGGSRAYSVVIGGETNPPYYLFEQPPPHKPVISFDVFDTPIPLPKPIKQHFKEVMEDPAEWAKLCVNKYGAELVSIHLVSTDPLVKNTPADKAAKIVEEVLQAVKVPLIIGGSGSPDKDPEVLEKVAEAAAGERVLLASATLDMDYKRVANAAKKYGHVVLSWTQMDINNQKLLNRELLELGVPKDSIVMDPTTGALGYGLEYTFSIMERIRLAAIFGEEDVQMPLASGSTNAWGAREAWMKNPEWGPRELRGPLWEILTALTVIMAGCDLLFMMHPVAVKTTKYIIDELFSKRESGVKPTDWITAKFQ